MGKKLPTPPVVSGGWPILGHALEFKKDDALMRRGYKEHGRIFTIKLGPAKCAVLAGPDLHRQYFSETDTKLDMARPYRFLEPMFGKIAFVAEPEVYKNHRTLMYEPFRRQKMLDYIGITQSIVQKWLDNLGKEGKMDIVAEILTLVQNIAGDCMLGEDFQEKAGREFWEQYLDLEKGMDPILPPNLPLPKFRKRDRAKKRMREILKPIIKERREKPDNYDDFLQDLVSKSYQDGTKATDEEIFGWIIALMFAGHETTAGQASWSIIQLLQHPDYLTIVQNELQNKFPYRTQIEPATLSSLEHTRWAVEETSRMKPSAFVTMRMVKEEMEVGEFRVPKGWMMIVSPDVSHFLPEIFTDPEKYDPFRFSPGRKEASKDRFALVGFGGGVHKCAGMNFAMNEMQIVTAMLFQQFDLELETLDVKLDRSGGGSRPGQTWVNYKRKDLSDLVSDDIIKEAVQGGCPHIVKMSKKDTNH